MTSHASHDHAATPQARAACRKAESEAYTQAHAIVDSWIKTGQRQFLDSESFNAMFVKAAIRLELADWSPTIYSDPIRPIMYQLARAGVTLHQVTRINS